MRRHCWSWQYRIREFAGPCWKPAGSHAVASSSTKCRLVWWAWEFRDRRAVVRRSNVLRKKRGRLHPGAVERAQRWSSAEVVVQDSWVLVSSVPEEVAAGLESTWPTVVDSAGGEDCGRCYCLQEACRGFDLPEGPKAASLVLRDTMYCTCVHLSVESWELKKCTSQSSERRMKSLLLLCWQVLHMTCDAVVKTRTRCTTRPLQTTWDSWGHFLGLFWSPGSVNIWSGLRPS